jgi:hippurate hydrolase
VGGSDGTRFTILVWRIKQSGTVLPGLHSPFWAPDREPTLKTAVTAETAMLMDLMAK